MMEFFLMVDMWRPQAEIPILQKSCKGSPLPASCVTPFVIFWYYACMENRIFYKMKVMGLAANKLWGHLQELVQKGLEL